MTATTLPPQAPRTGFGIGPDGSYTRGGQAVAYVCAIWATLLFFPLVVVGAMLYTSADLHFAENPERSRRFVFWSWLCVSLFPPLAAALVGGVVAGAVQASK
ncbi:hypothetical protein [Actinomadura parmotrematis]|uniref:CD225/dispanin family protein n=1 Tax=Actinomadura parmotrematis TaxID=2864039 RepID=A0ABS7FUS4_9ACTN|nr:hypothetical protein [Actinomadura parmotrematis]MBW8484161.1 hypothetical protein [Actinomadura parmotrematis]